MEGLFHRLFPHRKGGEIVTKGMTGFTEGFNDRENDRTQWSLLISSVSSVGEDEEWKSR